jgi:hypothetical protein
MASKKNLKGIAIVATYLSTGVALGAGGIAIVNGKAIKIPPRGPASQAILTAVRELAALGRTAGR